MCDDETDIREYIFRKRQLWYPGLSGDQVTLETRIVEKLTGYDHVGVPGLSGVLPEKGKNV